jgi:predicted SnoaL-like aldol condensation-catalyzing enzyme
MYHSRDITSDPARDVPLVMAMARGSCVLVVISNYWQSPGEMTHISPWVFVVGNNAAPAPCHP